MRISDWSSDVCSSDLLVKNKIELDAASKTAAGKRTVTLPEVVADVLVDHPDRFTEPESSVLVFTSSEGEPLRRNNFRRRSGTRPSRDRKSVVSGKSVSVRVDLGGRRVIKKKKH